MSGNNSIIPQVDDDSQLIVIAQILRELQELALQTRPDIVVAIPGRLIDHLRNAPSFSLDSIEILVLDEAD